MSKATSYGLFALMLLGMLLLYVLLVLGAGAERSSPVNQAVLGTVGFLLLLGVGVTITSLKDFANE
jgi:hypothetical protein